MYTVHHNIMYTGYIPHPQTLHRNPKELLLGDSLETLVKVV
jgi:hypothetical protein